MKIRTDFVTNSSSSSFILIGISIDNLLEQTDLTPEDIENKIEEDNFLSIKTLYDYSDDMCIILNNVQTLLNEYSVTELKQYVSQYIQDIFNITININDILYDVYSIQDN